ncbi:lon protease homolog, mitochondrial [[Candida] railenensis]|uniref:endopeptidase La n=1 Tax=[Candida] railenensis TaxID=45579 RepID=A0A9P0VYI9_9ASCO|nr:lon protease homolog, mitochondrial [[Candida] railenensis]
MIRRSASKVNGLVVKQSLRSASTAYSPMSRVMKEWIPATKNGEHADLPLNPIQLQQDIRMMTEGLRLSRELERNGWLMKSEEIEVDEKKDDDKKGNIKNDEIKEDEIKEDEIKEDQIKEDQVKEDEVKRDDSVPTVGSVGTGSVNNGKGSAGDDGNSPVPPPPPPSVPKSFPPLLAIPMRDRPPVPGTIFAINVEDREVIKAIDAMIENKHPHFLLFHSKDSDVNSDVIQDENSVHQIGVHCVLSKITKPEERKDDDNASLIVAYAQSRCKLEELTLPGSKNKSTTPSSTVESEQSSGDSSLNENSSSNVDFPTAYLSNFKVSYATTKFVAHEPYEKNSEVISQLVSEIKRTAVGLTANNEVARDQLIRADKFEPHDFADYVASLSLASADQIQAILEAVNVQERLEMVLDLIQIEDDLKRVKNKTTENMRRATFENQNKAFFKEFISQFQKVAGLNEKGEGNDKISKYMEKLKGKTLTTEAQEAFDYELDKLKGQHENSSESFVIEKYLDWLVSVPWGVYSRDLFNLKKAKSTLEQDHYGLEDVKQRILEFISLGKISGNVDGKILCLVGPPGTGKTSIAKSIAESLGRKYVRIAMGGVQDVHELKGHRRTYIGAVPGRIILALKQAQTSNPLMLIDEIDKLDTTSRGGGGASSAFLEILDPEQNHTFIDNYLDVKVDLSKVLFVCTANYLGNIAPPLRDRMEVIEVNGYTTSEKVEITKRHLIPQAAKKAGLEGGKVEIPDKTIIQLIERYCRESGLRNTKKHIGRIFSKAAFKIVEQIENKEAEAATALAEAEPLSETKVDDVKEAKEGKVAKGKKRELKESDSEESNSEKRKSSDFAAMREELEKDLDIRENTDESGVEAEALTALVIPDDIKLNISPELLKDYIGPETYPRDRVYDTLPAGVATGLAYSGSGNGDALYIESILTNSISSGTGHPGIRVTGSLKDVMKESASISYSFAKSFLTKRFPKNRFYEAADIHVHCPDGAIPKDGPSAGISFTTSLVSLALNKPIAGNIAMTGELTVTGRVLAVGGLREKILGAKRYGCNTIIFPKDIENVLEDIPEEVKEGVTFVPVEWYHEVFEKVFPDVTQQEGNSVWDEDFAALESKKKKDKK